jgi:hypothetical protein
MPIFVWWIFNKIKWNKMGYNLSLNGVLPVVIPLLRHLRFSQQCSWNLVFSDMMQCGLLNSCRRFGKTRLPPSWLKMDLNNSFETSKLFLGFLGAENWVTRLFLHISDYEQKNLILNVALKEQILLFSVWTAKLIMYAKEQRIDLVLDWTPLENASLSLLVFMCGSESQVEFRR